MMHSTIAPSQSQLEPNTSKTPARSTTKTRRALGDISNRKVASVYENHHHHHHISKTTTPSFHKAAATTTKKSNYNEVFKPVVNPEILLRNTSTKHPPLQVPNDHQPSLQRVPSAVKATKRSNNNNNVTFNIPENECSTNHQTQQQQQQRVPVVPPALKSRSNNPSLWNYNDESEIELPAGRLYHQQQQLYDDDDDYDSDLSLEGAKTFRHDIIKIIREEHQTRIQEKNDYIDYCVENLINICNIDDDDDDDDETFLADFDEQYDHRRHHLFLESNIDDDYATTYIDFPPAI